MRYSILILCTLTLNLFATSYQRYQEYQKFYPHVFENRGTASSGEIEILIDEESIKKAEDAVLDYHLKKGFSDKEAYEFSRVGVVAEDCYVVWFRDAVMFPSMKYGTYDRFIWKTYLKDNLSGAVILPLINEDKIVLNVNYRHSIRAWVIELPRGVTEKGETTKQTAIRELKEETGYIAEDVFELGNTNTDTGLLDCNIPLILTKVSSQGSTNHEYSEAILKTITLSVSDVKKAIMQGFIEVEINGSMQKVACQDPFLNSSMYLAELKGFIKP